MSNGNTDPHTAALSRYQTRFWVLYGLVLLDCSVRLVNGSHFTKEKHEAQRSVTGAKEDWDRALANWTDPGHWRAVGSSS